MKFLFATLSLRMGSIPRKLFMAKPPSHMAIRIFSLGTCRVGGRIHLITPQILMVEILVKCLPIKILGEMKFCHYISLPGFAAR